MNMLSVLVGQKIWSAKSGVGSFLTLEMGQKIGAHGTYHLWVQNANWSINSASKVLCHESSVKGKIIETVNSKTQRLRGD
jgi:hypothetical protein